jgi:hypothetical protein
MHGQEGRDRKRRGEGEREEFQFFPLHKLFVS